MSSDVGSVRAYQQPTFSRAVCVASFRGVLN